MDPGWKKFGSGINIPDPQHCLVSLADVCRCCCSGTEGLVRGQVVNDTGAPIMIPVGPETLGRIINVIGDPIDERGPVPTDKRQVRGFSVVDPHHLDADLDSAFHPDALQDADPDSDFYLMQFRIRLFTSMRNRIQILATKKGLNP